MSLNDGQYVVLFSRTNPSGVLQDKEVVGGFWVDSGNITKTDGICTDMLPIGPISASTMLRICYGLNNAYYEVKNISKLQSETIKKSNCWRIKVKGKPGWHDVDHIISPKLDSADQKNIYVLVSGDHIPQDFVEDLDIPRSTKTNKTLRHSREPMNKANSPKRAAVIAVWDGRYLLMGRRYNDNKWDNPGGYLHPDESPEDGAKRELYEETGIMADKLMFLGEQKYVDSRGNPLIIYVYMYQGHPKTSTMQMDPSENVQHWQWIDMKNGIPSEVLNNLRIPYNRNALFKKLKSVIQQQLQRLKKSEERRFSFFHGSEKLREIRDFIDKNGGMMKGRDLEKVYNLSSMGLGHLKDSNGNVTSTRVQEAINSLPKYEFLYSEDVFGADPTKTPAHPSHPLHTQYKKLYGATVPPGEELPDPIAKQKHSSEPSKVFQINFTPEHIQELKQAGVYETFARMNRASVMSNHPVRPENGIGWVRYTEGPDGIFIDEIQSDLAQSYLRQFEKQAQLALETGFMTPEEIEKQRVKMHEAFPEEHCEKIKQIAFGDKQPAAILHDAFHNWLRQKGYAGKPIHMWTTEGKSSTALSHTDVAAPGHMQFTYTQNPRRMGYKPAQYGELTTQTGPHAGKPTQKTILRKTWLLNFLRDWTKEDNV